MSTDLYKSQGIHSKEYRQSERRRELLEIQKQRRIESIDEHRSIEPIKRFFRKSSPKNQIAIKNKLMLSEWLTEKPNDIDKWYMKPCPKGIRVLVIAADGATRVFNKRGCFMKRFRSKLPGDYRIKGDMITILDCIYVESMEEFFVLDAIAYGNQALTDCETEFRFFWIESQIRETCLDQIDDHNEYPFRIVDKCNCGDEQALNEFLSKYPIWQNNQPELDGLLFYHKEASYVHGTTPLVGWLFAFMIPELFDVPHLNENHLKEKPDDYTDYLTFIRKFDNDMLEKQKNRRYKRTEHMDEDTIDENSAASVIRESMELENTTDDDFQNEFHIPV